MGVLISQDFEMGHCEALFSESIKVFPPTRTETLAQGNNTGTAKIDSFSLQVHSFD